MTMYSLTLIDTFLMSSSEVFAWLEKGDSSYFLSRSPLMDSTQTQWWKEDGARWQFPLRWTWWSQRSGHRWRWSQQARRYSSRPQWLQRGRRRSYHYQRGGWRRTCLWKVTKCDRVFSTTPRVLHFVPIPLVKWVRKGSSPLRRKPQVFFSLGALLIFYKEFFLNRKLRKTKARQPRAKKRGGFRLENTSVGIFPLFQ